ncbi:IMP dehydrogenase [Halovenus aranensis]|jgi:IMP dehydrogenase|uniref:IMP dehydrogenase n=1 Tax=Halovenus aranensis TaxID=890420 RepID=A0A1G8XF20_9EURY|nr:CBS domain-containing protein [Halovenus aranensis]SDJ89209.1 IMP dehydrogenase [Halovenus aranensis]
MAPDETVLVREVMSTPLETIPATESVQTAAERMRDHDISGLFVPGPDAGIVTTTDIVDVVAAGDDPAKVTVGDVMTAPVERVTTEVELNEAAEMMTTYGIKHLPVVDNQSDYVGMVSSTDTTSEFE